MHLNSFDAETPFDAPGKNSAGGEIYFTQGDHKKTPKPVAPSPLMSSAILAREQVAHALRRPRDDNLAGAHSSPWKKSPGILSKIDGDTRLSPGPPGDVSLTGPVACNVIVGDIAWVFVDASPPP